MNFSKASGFLENFKYLPEIRRRVLSATRHTDLALAFLVVMIIALMILPLPPFILDTLIAANLSISIILLMVSLYITRSVKLYTFPSLLLFTTLFRIALNIATTRQILLHANAGEIINTFGKLVIGGNYIVGAIIFIIITVVQFVVISKGGERVAEVAARFTLDSLPGKQMSIDAELRAGGIDQVAARKRRSMLEKESQMYGAMDGAMKFVKGDAIAGLIIAAVNILGGLGVGVLQHNMELVKAAQLYAVLSIGDGLVSQIPSLFSSITAGIIVTKVSSDESMNLGADIGAQLLAYPKALLIGSAIITAFILMPGFPKFQFLLIGGIIAIVGYVLYSTKNKARPSAEDIAESPRAADAAALIGFQPLSIRLSPALFERAGGFRLEESLKSSSVRLSSELGFPLPTAAVKVDPSIGENQYEISVQEVLAASGKLFAGIVVLQGQAFANQRIDDMPWLENAVIAEQQTAANPPAGCMVLHESEILSQHAAFISASHAPDFLSIQEVRRILDAFSVTNDAVVNETLHHIQLPKIAEVLRLLLREGIPLRNMNAILQSLIEWAPVEKNAEALAERARVAQRRYISHAATSGTYELSAIMIDTALEDGIRQAIRVTPFGTTIDLPPQIQQDIARQIESSISEAPEGRPLAVVCSMDVRRLIRMLCEHIQPIPVVVSIQELTSEVIVHTIGRVSLQE